VAFNHDTTVWQLSYDGRKREPVNLPMKFPLVLAHGAEGIAVGLSTKIMPHNFIEIIKASIASLKGRKSELIPISHGRLIDASNYNGGARGGKIRVRAKIREIDKKTLQITEIPFRRQPPATSSNPSSKPTKKARSRSKKWWIKSPPKLTSKSNSSPASVPM
jgi:topoisomerase-4 subunit A